TKTRLTGGFTITNAVLDGPGTFPSTTRATPTAIPGGLTRSHTATDIQLALPGPFPGGSVVNAPNIITTVTATGAPGTKISSKVAGTLTSANPTPPFADAGFGLTANISLGSVPTSCAPNYG